VFTCDPENQQKLVDAWVRATEETLGKLPGIISSALHRRKDGARVLNYAQWRSAEDWETWFALGAVRGSEKWCNMHARTRICRKSATRLKDDEAGSNLRGSERLSPQGLRTLLSPNVLGYQPTN
jgi:hypothetical protein